MADEAAARRASSLGPPTSRQSSHLGARTSSTVGFQTHENLRRQSTHERLNEILENARERAETMGHGNASPRAPGSPVLGRQPSSASQPIPEHDDVDEWTGIVSRGSDLNYQSLAPSNGPRAPKSILSNQRSPPSGVDDMHYRSFQGQDAPPEPKEPWWKATLQRYQSVELENKGSVARDHLAIERTFLAWLRTSLAFASIGIAVTQLFRLNTSLAQDPNDANMETLRRMGKPLGAIFLGISILTLCLGYKRYFQSQEWVMKGKFPASRGTVTIVAFVALAIMVASLAVVIAIQPSN